MIILQNSINYFFSKIFSSLRVNNFERAVEGSILTAGKKLSENLNVIIRAIN